MLSTILVVFGVIVGLVVLLAFIVKAAAHQPVHVHPHPSAPTMRQITPKE